MKLTRRETLPSSWPSLQEEFNRFLSRPWGTLSEFENENLTWAPQVDIKEEKERFLVRADLPGIEAKDVEITLENGMLTIRGERREERKEEDAGYRRVERFTGQFFRRFALPDATDPDKVKAHMDKGVLEVEIPKAKESLSRRIEVH